VTRELSEHSKACLFNYRHRGACERGCNSAIKAIVGGFTLQVLRKSPQLYLLMYNSIHSHKVFCHNTISVLNNMIAFDRYVD
jgi:hypothetical protein